MTQIVNWDKLKIAQSELDNLLNLDLFSSWAIDLNFIFIQHKLQYLKSFLITELSVLFLEIILLFPLNLIISRNLGIVSNNTGGFISILVIALLFSTLVLLVLNYYLWSKAKKLKSTAIILDKIKQYNQLIDSLQFFNQINYRTYSDDDQTRINSAQLSKIQTALKSTKYSLLNSLELEKIISSNRENISDRYQLFINLEDDLIRFLSLPQDRNHSEYQELLTEVVQIGLSVHQEVRKIQTLKQKKETTL